MPPLVAALDASAAFAVPASIGAGVTFCGVSAGFASPHAARRQRIERPANDDALMERNIHCPHPRPPPLSARKSNIVTK
jgi:hypothetical protein